LLQATLGRSEPPVQIKLMISQATAPQPGFASVPELDEVLGYYERPNRESILRALYERAAALQPTEPVAKEPTLDAIAPLPSRSDAKPKPKTPPKPPEVRRRHRKLAIAAVLLLAILGGGAYYARTANLVSDPSVTAFAEKASDSVSAAVVSGLSAVTETVGLGRIITGNSSDAVPAPPPAPAAVAPAPASPPLTARRRPASIQPVPKLPIAVFDLGIRPPVESSPAVAESPSSAADADTKADAPVETNGSLYRESDTSVIPPVGIRPQLPRELPPDVHIEDLTRVELLILEDGTVETVRLVSSPRSVHDSMLLSAIKAWEFQPAIKDGRPVRFLKTVWIAQ
jgi:hypothetical protein